MRKYFLNKLTAEEITGLTKRPAINLEKIINIVKPVLNDIKINGLNAALKYAGEFDGFTGEEILVSKKEFDDAENSLSPEIKSALKTAFANIEKFHIKQLPVKYEVETMPGVNCSREYRAIENVALYIPGGRAVLP